MLPLERTLRRKAHYTGEWGRVAMASVNQERFSVSTGVELPSATFGSDGTVMNAVLGLERHPRSPRRQEALRVPVGREGLTERIPVVCREGVSINTGRMILAVLVFMLCVLFLLRMSEMTETSKSVSSLRTAITEEQKANNDLKTQLAAASSDASVGYEAAKRGMISANGVPVTPLTAPATRTSETQTAQETVPPAHSEFFATLLGQ